MSLQAILILLVFPEGAIKRYISSYQTSHSTHFCIRFMLRVFFCVLGILVTSEGHLSTSKVNLKITHQRVFYVIFFLQVLISNKVSYVDHIVLHLACKCVTVSGRPSSVKCKLIL